MKNIYAEGSGRGGAGGGEGGRRRRAILAVVGEGGVRSQEDLQRRLRRQGIVVAQPTLSRDLKALGLAKAPTGYVAAPAPAFVPTEAPHGALDPPLRRVLLSVRPP